MASIVNKALPFATTVGSRLLSDTVNLARDLLSEENFAQSGKGRLASAGRCIVADFTTRRQKRPATQPCKKTSAKKRKCSADASWMFLTRLFQTNTSLHTSSIYHKLRNTFMVLLI